MKNLYRNELDKACFVHEAANSDSKDLAKRPISENILEDRTYEIDRNCQYDGYQEWSINYFIRKQNREWI